MATDGSDGSHGDEGRLGRLPWWEPGQLDDRQRDVYDSIVGGPRAANRTTPLTDGRGRVYGPFNTMLFNADVGLPMQNLGAAIRYQTSLSSRRRELAILLVAGQHQSNFEWYSHVPLGLAAGLGEDDLERARGGAGPDSYHEEDRVEVELVQSLLSHRDVDDELFARAEAALGQGQVVELVLLVGYYQMLALQMQVFRVPVPAGVTPTW